MYHIRWNDFLLKITRKGSRKILCCTERENRLNISKSKITQNVYATASSILITAPPTNPLYPLTMRSANEATDEAEEIDEVDVADEPDEADGVDEADEADVVLVDETEAGLMKLMEPMKLVMVMKPWQLMTRR